jgi:adenine-specific DNA-methyltransferase
MLDDRMSDSVNEQRLRLRSRGGGSANAAQATLIKGGPKANPASILSERQALWRGDTLDFLTRLPAQPIFDLVVTSPPYNIGKSYEVRKKLDAYLREQEAIIDQIVLRLKRGASICWQVGTFIEHNEIFPLDIEFAPLFRKHGLKMRNRIVWAFGHGLHNQKRFSGRHETILWFTNTPKRDDPYTFNLDDVRVPAKYPGKRHSKDSPHAGKLSGHPLGKNPEDVWEIPNVKNNHIEKTEHPCQFPVGLVERLVLALTNEGDLVFDPYAGVASAGVAAAVHNRRFWGCELMAKYANTGARRMQEALDGKAVYRPHDKPVFDHTKSSLSKLPEGGEHSRKVALEPACVERAK